MNPPDFNRLNHLTGEKVESPVGKILAAANEIAANAVEVDAAREALVRVDELLVENGELAERNHTLVLKISELKRELEWARSVEPFHGVTTGGLR
jgi:hypothetical protein